VGGKWRAAEIDHDVCHCFAPAPRVPTGSRRRAPVSFHAMKRVSPEETAAHTTRTVERACALMSAFSASSPRLSLTELAARVTLPKATVHRLASSLVTMGFMEHREDGRYSLGLKLGELAALARADLDIVSACTPAMDALAAATRETVLLTAADWDALEIVVVATRVSPQTLSVIPATGERMAMPPGAPGKALLLGLPADEAESVLRRLELPALTSKTHTDRAQLMEELAIARSEGFAVADEEYADGVSGAAVPVLFKDGRPRAAIAVVGPSVRLARQVDRIGRLALEHTSALRPAPVRTPRVAAA
jgi:DNA-binding IclR family transcriptional regulator